MKTFSVNQTYEQGMQRVLSRLGVKTPKTDKGKEWYAEMFITTFEDRMAGNDQVVMDAYAYQCEKNTEASKIRKESPLLSPEEIEAGIRGVSESVASYIHTEFDEIENASELRDFVNQFMDLHHMLTIEEGVDIFDLLKHAMNSLGISKLGDSSAMTLLRELALKHNFVDLLCGILQSEGCFSAIEGAFA